MSDSPCKLPSIGIDLGTSFLRVGIFRNNDFEPIWNEMHTRQTPCYAIFEDGKCKVQDWSIQYIEEHLDVTVFCIKRLIGRTYDEAIAQAKKHSWPFKIINSEEEVKIELNHREGTAILSVTEIVSVLFSKAKQMAESYLKEYVESAVVTIPDGFNESQVEATLNAGRIAGFKTLNAIGETSAAAVAYYAKQKRTALCEKQSILVLHLGGGAFGISVFEISERLISPIQKACTYDTELGGLDFDTAIVKHVGVGLNRDTLSGVELFRLYKDCENAKKLLASLSEATISARHIDLSITMDEVEAIHDVRHFLDKITGAVVDTNNTVSPINKIILVGGSTRIKSIETSLRNQSFKIDFCLNAEEAVVYGASRVAYEISVESELFKNLLHKSDLSNTKFLSRHIALALKVEEREILEAELKCRNERLNSIENSIYAIEKDIKDLDTRLTSLKEKYIVIFNRMKELRANATDTDVDNLDVQVNQLKRVVESNLQHFHQNLSVDDAKLGITVISSNFF